LSRIFTESLRLSDEILEIGAGTGYYTLDIARMVKSVTALERSAGMARILTTRIEQLETKASNVTLVECDFFDYSPEEKFDVVIAIGVLDTVSNWQRFLDRCISMARRCVIFTAPQPSFWGIFYELFGSISRFRVRLYGMAEMARHLEKFRVQFYETGLKRSWARGLTIVAVVELQEA